MERPSAARETNRRSLARPEQATPRKQDTPETNPLLRRKCSVPHPFRAFCGKGGKARTSINLVHRALPFFYFLASRRARRASTHPSRLVWRARPMASAPAGTSLVMHEPAPI